MKKKGNPVARHAPRFNKPATHKDRKKADRKGERKHRDSDGGAGDRNDE